MHLDFFSSVFQCLVRRSVKERNPLFLRRIEMRDSDLFSFVIGISELLSGLLLFSSIIIVQNVELAAGIITLMLITIIAFYFGKRIECKDSGMLFNNLVLSQRDSLAWYVSNAMHGFRLPSYQLVLVESFYDKGKTIHTELAKLRDDVDKNARTNLVNIIQTQLNEWEIILNQLRDRIDELEIHSRT